MKVRAAALLTCLCVSGFACAQDAPPGLGPAVQHTETPKEPADPAQWDAATILRKTFAVYTQAKTYQADWRFVQDVGRSRTEVLMQVRSKAPDRLFVHVGPSPAAKPAAGPQASETDTSVPVMTVVADGRTAWFQNDTAKVYYRITMPAGTRLSPLAFFPQIKAVQSARRATDAVLDGRQHFVLEATGPDGARIRVEIDAAALRIRRMTSEVAAGDARAVSTLTVAREVFDKDIPESAFGFRAMPGGREIAAPLGAGAAVGIPDAKPPAGTAKP